MTRLELIAALTAEGARGTLAIEYELARLARWPTQLLPPAYTGIIDAALRLMPAGFFWTCGGCYLTGHVTIGPDYNGPLGERLHRQFPVTQWNDGVSFDLALGDGPQRTAMAICAAVVWADAWHWQDTDRVFDLEPQGYVSFSSQPNFPAPELKS